LPSLCLAASGLAACSGDEPAAPPDCDASGNACTWLGLPGEIGFNGDGRSRLETKLSWSMDMAFDADDNAYFIDWNNHLVRRVLPDQTVESVVGLIDPAGFPGDGAPEEATAEGAIGTTVALNHPTDLAIDPDGTVLIMAWHNHKLRELNPDTLRVHIECGRGAGFAGDTQPANLALFKQPRSLQLGPNGERYIVDQQNFRVRVIGADGIINTLAGTGTKGDGSAQGDGGPALQANLNLEAGDNPAPTGGLALLDHRLFYSDTLAHRVRVIDLETLTIDTVAGTGEKSYTGDGGAALDATLNLPGDLEIGPEGDLYVADTDNSAVRAINLDDGTIRTVAGTGVWGLDPREGLPATETLLLRPFGIEFDHKGNLYIADTINSRIVRVAR